MNNDVRTFFSTLQSDFVSGELDDVVQFLAKPLVVYSPAGVVVIPTAEDIVQRAQTYRGALLALATEGGAFEILSQDQIQNDRVRVTLRASYFTASGDETASSLSRYFLVRTAQDYLVEMIEYLEFPLPLEELEDQT